MRWDTEKEKEKTEKEMNKKRKSLWNEDVTRIEIQKEDTSERKEEKCLRRKCCKDGKRR